MGQMGLEYVLFMSMGPGFAMMRASWLGSRWIVYCGPERWLYCGSETIILMAECNAWWGVIWGWKLGVHMCGDYCVAECSTRLGVIVGSG